MNTANVSTTTVDSFQIRRAEREDSPRILQLIQELASYEKLSHEVVTTVEDLERDLFGERPCAEVLLVCLGQEVVGYALFFHNYSTFAGRPGIYLEDLFVKPSFRGRGYGKALMVALAKLAVERGCARFEWTVLDWNQPAIDFYRSLGAVIKQEWRIVRVDGEGLEKLAKA